jgi:CRP-like cAMP-binding protein
MIDIAFPRLIARPDPKVATMRGLAGLEAMPKSVLKVLAAHTELVELPAGTRLTTEGRHVHMMFGIVAGTVDLKVGGQPWSSAGPGEWVGQCALARNCPAATTAVTRGPVVACVVGRADLRAYLAVPDLVASLLS